MYPIRMKRLLIGLLFTAVLAGSATAAQPGRVLSVEWQAGGGKLRWVLPTTLKPVGSTVLNVGGAPADIVAVSPDGTLAAIGGGANGRLRLVRLAGLRPAGLLWLGEGSVFKGIWATPGRLVVLLGGLKPAVLTIDPAARRVVHREALAGTVRGAVRAGNRLLTLLTPQGTIGPARLAVVEANGSVRTVALPGITAGFAPAKNAEGTVRQASPGLAADPSGARTVVVGQSTLVIVSLDTLRSGSSRSPRARRRASRSGSRAGAAPRPGCAGTRSR